jgi:hypothetical protein
MVQPSMYLRALGIFAILLGAGWVLQRFFGFHGALAIAPAVFILYLGYTWLRSPRGES